MQHKLEETLTDNEKLQSVKLQTNENGLEFKESVHI